MLNFDLKEVRELREIIKALRLEHRYISRSVIESYPINIEADVTDFFSFSIVGHESYLRIVELAALY